MRETDFIRNHSTRWQGFEDSLKTPVSEPDQLREMFVQVTDDLSHSRTFYPNRSVRVYLNDLAQRLFFAIYFGRQAKPGSANSFWLEELPLLMYQARRDMLIAFLVFWVAFLAGALSCAMDPNFPALVLGEEYMEMTRQNILAGDPMAVYKSRGQFDMALGITANNLYVAFLSFISGVFFAIGSLMVMVSNGVMVGTFQTFFIQQGLLQESFLTIWIHGALEISAIIIAGGAGITLGRGLAFPGTYTRRQAFQQSARRGLKIFFGIAPVIVLAALFESFLTRYTGTPDWVRGIFIFSCLTFILIYFWWFPRFLAARKGSQRNDDADFITAMPDFPDLNTIRSGGEIFREVFTVLRHNGSMILLFSLFATLLFCIPVFLFSGLPPQEFFLLQQGLLSSVSALGHFYLHEKVDWIPWLNVPILAWFSALLLPRMMGLAPDKRPVWWISMLKSLLPAAFFVFLLQNGSAYLSFVILLGFPWILCWIPVIVLEKGQKDLGTRRAFSLIWTNSARVLHVFLLITLSAGLFFSLLDTALIKGFINLSSWIIRLEPPAMEAFSAIFLAALTYFFHYLGFAYILAGFGLLYFTLQEITDAPGLRKKVQLIGKKRLLRGLEQESPI